MALKGINSKDVLEKMIEETINGLVHLDDDSGRVLFTPSATKLPNRQRVLVYLVALRGLHFLNSGLPSGAARNDIEEDTRIGRAEVRRALSSLQTDRLIARQIFGQYFVCEPALPIAKAEIDLTRDTYKIK